MAVENINEYLYKLFKEELDDLSMGHGYNKSRLAYMKSIVTLMLYLRYAILDNATILRILSNYESI